MKDQQTNNMDTQDVMNNNSQEQDTVQTENSNVSQADSPEVAATESQPLSTEGFHTLLEANSFRLSKLRTAYFTEIADLRQKYDDTLDSILEKEHQATYKLREIRAKYEAAKEEFEQALRQLKRERNEAGRAYNQGKVEAKNRWATVNEDIQSERHNIFERFRNSGGYSRKVPKDSCTQAGPKTRKEE